ncbi:MAG: ribosome silencing factor [Deltaproteobacteria bacterium]|nr:ribosome silencing factor [Deltaproteobacteria bacterium]
MQRSKTKKTGGLNSRAVAKLVAQAADDVKAVDIEVLDLRKTSAFTDFFVIATGRSDRQVRAISDRILENLEKEKMKPIGIEGYRQGHWILMDYFNVVVHIFYEEVRSFYALDRLWGDAPRVTFRFK